MLRRILSLGCLTQLLLSPSHGLIRLLVSWLASLFVFFFVQPLFCRVPLLVGRIGFFRSPPTAGVPVVCHSSWVSLSCRWCLFFPSSPCSAVYNFPLSSNGFSLWSTGCLGFLSILLNCRLFVVFQWPLYTPPWHPNRAYLWRIYCFALPCGFTFLHT